MSKERELLERALEKWNNCTVEPINLQKLFEEIRAYLLSEPVIAESASTEPVGKTDKFNRLTEVEVLALMNRDINGYSLICAVENQLAEKNQ